MNSTGTILLSILIGALLSTISYAKQDTVLKAAKLYRTLTGSNLLEGNPLKTNIENLVAAGRMDQAAGVITHPRNGAPEFYNNTVKNFALPINRDHSMGAAVTDLTALFIGVTRDDAPIDDLMYGNYYYFDPNPIETGNPRQKRYPMNPDDDSGQNIFTDATNALGHYTYLERRGSLRDELVKSYSGNGSIGVFTTYGFAESYYLAGTNRRPWKGIVEHFYCSEMPTVKTLYIPDNYVRRDVPRVQNASSNQFLTDCKGCHAMMDPISFAFQLFDYKDDQLIKKPVFSEKFNETNFGSYIPTSDMWWLYYTDAQNGTFGFQNVPQTAGGASISFANVADGLKMATGQGLRDLARVIAASSGFPKCLVKRMALQLGHKKIYSLPTFTEADKEALAGDEEILNAVSNELIKSRNLRRAFEQLAIKYVERQ